MEAQMKKLNIISPLLFVALLFVLAKPSYSQSLYFCEGVDDDGYAVNSSSSFTIPDDGGYLYFLVRMGNKSIDCNEVLFDIYKIESGGKETFENTIYQDVKPSWTWFWKKITFYDPGLYKVYVYDQDWKYVTEGKVRIR